MGESIVDRDFQRRCVIHGACRTPRLHTGPGDYSQAELIWVEAILTREELAKIAAGRPLWTNSGCGEGCGSGPGPGYDYGYGSGYGGGGGGGSGGGGSGDGDYGSAYDYRGYGYGGYG